MSRGKLNLQANDGAVVGLVVPDGLGSGERQIALGANLSGVTAYHLLQGNLSVSNEVITNGFSTTLYTGNGATQSVNTGIDMTTQWGNDASEKFGGLVWGKSRSLTNSHQLYDTVRGSTKTIWSDLTNAEATQATGLTSFNSNGFSLGSLGGLNTNLSTNASWNFQTTHRVSGITNHGKAYTCHYNPFTGFTIVKYEGSGIAGHEIPHHLGRKLGFVTGKNLSVVENWYTQFNDNNKRGLLNTTEALNNSNIFKIENEIVVSIVDSGIYSNANTSQYIIYGWANSYYDEADKLIGNYEIGVYQGAGVAGNKVTTRGKPAWVMVKRLDAVENWIITNNQGSSFDVFLKTNTSTEEVSLDIIDVASDGFTLKTTTSGGNISGGQYLYMVVYDNDSGSGKSKYPKATDTSNVQINNALIPLAHGVDSNGSKNSIVIANETITGLTYTQGKNYLYKTDTGYGVKSISPSYGKVNPLIGDFYNVITNKWYSNTNVEITESRNYLNHIVHADANGQVAYVEELPKIEYKDIIKANEFQGKNACTAWAYVDNSGSAPYIKDGIGFSFVIRTSTGVCELYTEVDFLDINYGGKITQNAGGMCNFSSVRYLNKVVVATRDTSGASINCNFTVEIKGGRN